MITVCKDGISHIVEDRFEEKYIADGYAVAREEVVPPAKTVKPKTARKTAAKKTAEKKEEAKEE